MGEWKLDKHINMIIINKFCYVLWQQLLKVIMSNATPMKIESWLISYETQENP